MPLSVVVLALGVLVPASARADHQHGMVTGSSESGSTMAAGVSLIAAEFDTMNYGGDYQAVVPSVHWASGRLAATGNLGVYRLQENGRELYGAGDAVVHGQARLTGTGPTTAGVALAVSAPTGDHQDGLGMGHPMVMPAGWARWGSGVIAIDGSLGYGQALAGSIHHSHGAWPLVEPMNESEVTWTASGNIALAKALHAGGRVSGAVPVGEGVTRVIGGVRVLWTEGRVDTAFEIQAGLAGDPFTVRGVLETALRF